MAAKHTIVTDKNKKLYSVKEIETELIVKTFPDYEKAKKYTKFVNSGGAFNGMCPPFMVKKEND